MGRLPFGEEGGYVFECPAVLVSEPELLAAFLVLEGCNGLIDEDFLDERGRNIVGGVLGRFLVGQDEF